MDSRSVIKWRVEDKKLFINSTTPLKAISSAILGQGFVTVDSIVNIQVDKDYTSSAPVLDLQEHCKQYGLNSNRTCGLLTAVLMNKLVFLEKTTEDIWVKVFVTAGVTNAAAAGKQNESIDFMPGTINIVVLTNCLLTEGAMVNSVMTATEAKSLALVDLGVKDVEDGSQASGTTSDAIVIATTGTGPKTEYTGTATRFGQLMAGLVRKAVVEGIKK